MARAVHQLLPAFAVGDAIGGAVRRTQEVLRRTGYRSEVYAETIHDALRGKAFPAAELEGACGPDDVVIYRLSIGSDVARLFENTPARRVIIYHNITPARYFDEVNPAMSHYIHRGREDLHRLAPMADLCIGDSSYNVTELREAGATRCVVVPPFVDLDRLHPHPAERAEPSRILFVGRIAVNKRHDDLIRALAALRAVTPLRDARLVLIGGTWWADRYSIALRRFAAEMGVDDGLDFSGVHVKDSEVSRQYAQASVFACASDHEGFCVPLLEAMAFSVPVLAYNAGAVAETVGGGGIVLDHKDPLVWAEVLHRMIDDQRLRARLIAAGHERLTEFAEGAVERRLADALASIGITPR